MSKSNPLSKTINENIEIGTSYFEARLKLQGTLKNPKKDTPAYNYKYATLPNILDMVKPVLNDLGFLILQSAHSGKIETRLVYRTGEVETCEFDIPDFGTEIQKKISYCSYLRRYSIMLLLCIAGENEDDDGQATVPEKPGFKKNIVIEKVVDEMVHGISYAFRKGVSKSGIAFEGWFPQVPKEKWGDYPVYKTKEDLKKAQKEEADESVNNEFKDTMPPSTLFDN